MKKRFFTVAILAVVVVALIWWLFRNAPATQPTAAVGADSVAATPEPTETNSLVAPPPGPTPATRTKEQRMSEVLALTSQTPITFYGKVVDQFGKPVVAAQVRANAEIVKRWMSQEWDAHFTTTDAAGEFQFTGLHGQSLVVSPAKEGYEFKSNNIAYEYAMVSDKDLHHPDRHAPVVFTMWKKKGSEKLIHTKLGTTWVDRPVLPVNGRPVTFDLETGKKVETGGDLTLKLTRDPGAFEGGRHFNWSVTLGGVNGGLLGMNDSYPNEAPAEGYQPSITVEMQATAPDWQRSISRSFYLLSRNGKNYGRINVEISVGAQLPEAHLTLSAYLNPDGSRNLEYDPSMDAGIR